MGVADATCPHCDVGEHEDIEHLLCVCPAYTAARDELKASLLPDRVSFSAQIVLGSFPGDMSADATAGLMESTGRFLMAIYETRGSL